MARHGKGQGPQRPMKGFRPGREPPQLKKQRAKQQFGDVSASQERLIELFAERSPDEARKLMRRWRVGFLAGGLALAVLGAVLYLWSPIAVVVAEIMALVLLVLWWRLHRQRDALEAMADAVSGPGKGKRKKK